MDNSVLRWLRKQGTMVSFKITLDRLYLLDELVEKGEFKNRSQAILTAIDELLRKYYPELESASVERLGDFVRADLVKGEGEV